MAPKKRGASAVAREKKKQDAANKEANAKARARAAALQKERQEREADENRRIAIAEEAEEDAEEDAEEQGGKDEEGQGEEDATGSDEDKGEEQRAASPPRKKRPGPGEQIARNPTVDTVFHHIEHYLHLKHYGTISKRMERKPLEKNNAEWAKQIGNEFDMRDIKDHPYKDLNSMPWKDTPNVLASAWKRVDDGEWKWRKVINSDGIRQARDANNFPRQPFTEEFEQQAKAASKRGKK